MVRNWYPVMEAGKSQALQLACWRPTRAGDVVPVRKPADSRSKESWHCRVTPKAGKTEIPPQGTQRSFFFWWESQPFILSGLQLIGWGPPHQGALSAFLGLPIQTSISSRNTPTATRRKMFDQISGYPVELTHKINYHSIFLTFISFPKCSHTYDNLPFTFPFLLETFPRSPPPSCSRLEWLCSRLGA